MSRPMNSRIKYLKRKACNIILPITDTHEITNGSAPTANISSGEIRVNKIISSNGTILAGIASSRQFNNGHKV
jgi:hypothetical protein